MPVVGVLAHAHVGDDNEVGTGVLHCPDGQGNDPVPRMAFGSPRVLCRRDAEQEDGPDAKTRGLPRFPRKVLHRELEYAGHRRDRDAHVTAVHGEQRIDELRRRKRRLPHHVPETCKGPQTPRPFRHRLPVPLMSSCRAPARSDPPGPRPGRRPCATAPPRPPSGRAPAPLPPSRGRCRR